MKSNCALLATAAVLFASITCEAATLRFSMTFSNQFGDGVLSNIADETGDVTSGLTWGILVAESGSDFSTPLSDLGLSAVDGAALASGYRYFSGGTTTDFAFSFDPPPGDGPNNGVISATNTIDASAYNDPGNPGTSIDAGDRFALIWFERTFGGGVSAGTRYGLLESTNFLLPADGSSEVPFDAEFSGDDPVRSATFVVVPEPSTAILAMVGALGIFRRRR